LPDELSIFITFCGEDMAMRLGDKIKTAREFLGMSQLALAMKCGWVSQSRVGNYETGLREPNFCDIKKLARALERPVIYFLDSEDDVAGDTKTRKNSLSGSKSVLTHDLNEMEKSVLDLFKQLTVSQQQGILNEIRAVYHLNEEIVATYRKRNKQEEN